MGSLFSKGSSSKKKEADRADKPGSAPARLENLDGTAPGKPPAVQCRSITPPDNISSQVGGLGLKDEQKVKNVIDEPLLASPTVDPETPGKRNPKKIDLIGNQTDGKKLAAALPAAITIPDDAQPWVQVFGETVVRNFSSTDWKDREQSIASIQRSLQNAKFLASKDPTTVYQATCQMLAKSLRDKVAPLYHASLELVGTLLSGYCSMLPAAVLHAGADQLMPILLHRCGNLNTRIHEASLQAILGVAARAIFGIAYVGPFALSPLPQHSKDASQAAQMFGRLDLISCLLTTFKSNQGMGPEEVLNVAKQGLEMADEKVRQTAIKVVVEVYRLKKMAQQEFEPERYLGPLKPALLQVLQRRFTEVDVEIAGGGTANGSAQGYSKVLPPLAASTHLPPLPGLHSRASGGLPNQSASLEVAGSAMSPGSSSASPAETSSSGACSSSSSTPLSGRPPRTPAAARSGTPPRSRARVASGSEGDGEAAGGSNKQLSPLRLSPKQSECVQSPKLTARSTSPSMRTSRTSASRECGMVVPGAVVGEDELSVPQYTALFGGPSAPLSSRRSSQALSKGSSVASLLSTYERVLDDDEEQLINYIIMKDEKAVAVAW